MQFTYVLVYKPSNQHSGARLEHFSRCWCVIFDALWVAKYPSDPVGRTFERAFRVHYISNEAQLVNARVAVISLSNAKLVNMLGCLSRPNDMKLAHRITVSRAMWLELFRNTRIRFAVLVPSSIFTRPYTLVVQPEFGIIIVVVVVHETIERFFPLCDMEVTLLVISQVR